MPYAAPDIRFSLRRVASLLALLVPFALPLPARDLKVNALQRNDRPLAGAVITVESEPGAQPFAAPLQAVMDQVNLAFVPDVLVVPVHSTVQFPNSDAVSHQVYSFSSAKTFQLPLYRGKAYPPLTFDQPGVITLGCNIHDNMLAYIVVTKAAYFGRTDARGIWSVADLPPGRYRVKVWHPLINELASLERVVDDTDTAVTLKLTRNLRPAPLTRRPQSWDY